MKRAFTLIELLVVITIIGILTALTLGAGGILRDKASRSRAAAEIAALDTALERYKIDKGDYPGSTSIPYSGGIYSSDNTSSSNVYLGSASVTITSTSSTIDGNGGRFLFASLMGRATLNETDRIVYPQYIEVKSNQVGSSGDYFQDPYKKAYGYYYSASGTQKSYFNMVQPDIWSTGGQDASKVPSTNSTSQPGYSYYLKWIKNWSSE